MNNKIKLSHAGTSLPLARASRSCPQIKRNLCNSGGFLCYKLFQSIIYFLQYNYLNLPEKITQNSKVTDYIYRADGVKVKKVFDTKATDYLDGFQYENSTLKFFPTSEGYFNVETGKYVYNYTDQLGNVRLSYAKNVAGTEIIEESNYYPFGLKHEGYNTLLGNPAYNYKYNGKELQENGMYDYGARMYMPDLGRWGVIDPLAEKMTRHSPYNYAFNNPIRFIDPDGKEAEYSAAQQAFINYRDSMPPDDHFNQFGQFLYTDNKKTNNIIIDFQNPITRKLNTAPWLSMELKDYIFNKNNAFVLANIANHYAEEAGIDLNRLKGNSMSVAIANFHFDGGKIVGTFSRFNGGEYNPDALMQANKGDKTVSLMVGNGKAHPYYNDKNNMISALSHEGGKISHLTLNPDNINISKLDLAKEHIKIYEHQMSSPLFMKTTPEFQQLMKKNYSNDKWYYNTYRPK